MRLPLELIVILVLAEIYQQDSDNSQAAVQTSAVVWAVVAMAALVLGIYVISRVGSAWSARRLKKNPSQRAQVYEAHGRIVAAERALLVAAYMVHAHFTSWPALVVRPDGLDAEMTVIGDDLLQILPFLLGSLAMWLGNYPANRALSPARWGLGEYLRGQARGLFFLLGPWMLLVALMDSDIYWPESVLEYYKNNFVVQTAVHALPLLLVMLFFPFYLIHLWPRRRMPAGPRREKLERLLARGGVRCRDLVVWNTGRGRMSNAAVMGLVPWARYIVFTDALLEDLDDAEVEAVLAHEVGHVRYHHMAFYVIFFVAFVMFAGVLLKLMPVPVQNSNWLVGMFAVVMVILYWRVVFGFLSRRFEREADIASCELVGTPMPLMSALEKLALASGTSRTANNWRHYSVAERVAYLARFGFEPEALKEHHGYVRIIKGASIVMVPLLAVLLLRGNERLLESERLVLDEVQLENYVSEHPHDYDKWAELARVQAKLRKYERAWHSFGEVIRLTPKSPEGYLGRAKLCWERDWDGHLPERGLEQARKAVDVSREALRTGARTEEKRKSLARSLAALAESAFLVKDLDLARTTVREALELRPDDDGLKKLLEKYEKAARRARTAPRPPKGSEQNESSAD
jgi:Zn-dependent protease with chaperone function